MRQLTQQAQVFITTGGDTDGNVCHLPFAPQNALRELINLNAGFQDLIAGIRSAVRNSDTVTQEG
ncbi:hypothetical protein D3C72_2298160 [compost metagenome]